MIQSKLFLTYDKKSYLMNYESENRLDDPSKFTWIEYKAHFGFNKINFLNATLTIDRTLSALIKYVKINGAYWFCTNVVDKNDEYSTITLRLDVIPYITSNKDIITNPLFVERIHENRSHIYNVLPSTDPTVPDAWWNKSSINKDNIIWSEKTTIEKPTLLLSSSRLYSIDFENKKPSEKLKETLNHAFWPVVIRTITTDHPHETSSRYDENYDVETGNAIIPLAPNTNTKIVTSGFPNPFTFNFLGLYNANKEWSADIIKIFMSPFPLYFDLLTTEYPLGTKVDNVFINAIGWSIKENDGEIYFTENQIYDSGHLKGLPKYRTLTHEGDFSSEYEVNNLVKLIKADGSSIDDTWIYNREPLIKFSKFKRLIAQSINGDSVEIPQEFLRDTLSETSLSITNTGIVQYLFPNYLPLYYETQHNQSKSTFSGDNSKILITKYTAELAIVDTDYKEFMRSNGNQFKTGLANDIGKSALSSVQSLAMGGIGFMTGNIGGAASGAMGFQSGIANIGSAIANYQAKKADLNHQVKMQQNDLETLKDLTMSYKEDYGMFKIREFLYGFTDIEYKAISFNFHKYGYQFNGILDWKYERLLNSRTLFNYLKTPKFSETINGSNLNTLPTYAIQDLMDEFDYLFSKGIRLWHDKDKYLDYTLENWERDIYIGIIKP